MLFRSVLDHLRPGARVVATGLQWAPAWAMPVNLFVLGAALYSVTTLGALDAPWRTLAPHLNGMTLEALMAGGVYLAAGNVGPPQ